MKQYELIIKSNDWAKMNWLYSYINDKSDYNAVPISCLNVGESMIDELEIFYFADKDFAKEFIRAIIEYWGKHFDYTLHIKEIEL